MNNNPYVMRISLNVLNHMGLHLYSNTPAVISETIANSWDADATEVSISINPVDMTISVRDNGSGMDIDDINDKFLYVGYRKRDSAGQAVTPLGRKPMGRKGIGKLSLFSIAHKIEVHTKKDGQEAEAFLMDASKIKEAIESEDHSSTKDYYPESIGPDMEGLQQGTILRIKELKQSRVTMGTINGLKKRLARRFNILGQDFAIEVDGKEVTFQDRDYFHKARFIFQYGDDYSQYCRNLDRDADTGRAMAYDRKPEFAGNSDDGQGKTDYKISGWIAIAHRSNDLDSDNGEENDNLNKIAILMRGKVAQEDILTSFRLGGMITKYIFGEISADFLDEDDQEDIATSSRQGISEEDPRYKALKSFLHKELKHIWSETNKLKDKKGLETALISNPHLKDWYEGLPGKLQPKAKKVFGLIDRANVEDDYKMEFYANGVLAFERLKMGNMLDLLPTVDEQNIETFLKIAADADAVESIFYREIVSVRLAVIQKLTESVAEDAKESVIEKYIFDHLWLLDPAWERATEYASMEKRIQNALPKNTISRTDIRYKRVAAEHVVLELKRGSRTVTKTEIEEQLKKYMEAVRKETNKDPDQARYPIVGHCLVGKLPRGWDNPDTRKADEDSLKPLHIRVMTYDELINNAESAYTKFLAANQDYQKLNDLFDSIRNYQPTDHG